jgi:hypothetical protein
MVGRRLRRRLGFLTCHDGHDKLRTQMRKGRQKFATQVDSRLAANLRKLARKQGRQIQGLVDEALADLLEKHGIAPPRPHVMRSYLASHEGYGLLYKKLAE